MGKLSIGLFIGPYRVALDRVMAVALQTSHFANLNNS